MYTGGAGGYSFYVRKGEQVIRQRKNNSNYGSGASRTYAQMIRRIKWGNLVNVFKAMKSWQPKAYDSKKQGQTDYNIFMQLNINKATAALTREMCLSGCAVVEPLQVSRGSLPPIALALAGSGNQYVSDIVISNAIQSATTVGQLSTDILTNNPQFQEGDNLAFCVFYNWKDSRVEWPFVSTRYTEITLDKTSSVVVNSIPLLDNRLSKSTGGNLQASFSAGSATSPNNEVGMVLIHTRKSASVLAVSSQEVVMNGNSILSEFSGNTWYQTCIDSYGLTDEVPLDPNFPDATVTSVTANGSAISDGESLTGSQELRIYGSNLSTRNIQLFFEGVEYFPLVRTSEYYLYIVGDNGTVTINVNKRRYMSVTVDGIDVPEELPTNLSCMLNNASSPSYDIHRVSERVVIESGNCLNYPHKPNNSYPYFLFLFGNLEVEENDFTVDNSSQSAFAISGSSAKLNITPEDPDLPVVVRFKGFIVCVANYTL